MLQDKSYNSPNKDQIWLKKDSMSERKSSIHFVDPSKYVSYRASVQNLKIELPSLDRRKNSSNMRNALE